MGARGHGLGVCLAPPLSEGGGEVRGALEVAAAELADAFCDEGTRQDADDAVETSVMVTHGRLTPSASRQVQVEGWRELVAPTLKRMLA